MVRPLLASIAVAAVALACRAADLGAQARVPRPFTTFRQQHGERDLKARVSLMRGSLRIVPSRPGELYRMELVYDQRAFVPIATFRPADNSLLLRVASPREQVDAESSTTSSSFRIGGRDEHDDEPVRQKATFALSPDVDAALELTLVDVGAELELGGLRLTSLDLTSSIGTATARFSKPNGIACRHLSVAGNVSETSLLGLGNSRCEKVSLHGTVGETVLDFGGTWTSNMTVDATATVGLLTLRLPRQIGVRLAAKTFLAGLEPNGLIRDGGAYVSRNYADATYRLDINLTTTLGGVEIEWIGD
jgi:hypothetical protein